MREPRPAGLSTRETVLCETPAATAVSRHRGGRGEAARAHRHGLTTGREIPHCSASGSAYGFAQPASRSRQPVGEATTRAATRSANGPQAGSQWDLTAIPGGRDHTEGDIDEVSVAPGGTARTGVRRCPGARPGRLPRRWGRLRRGRRLQHLVREPAAQHPRLGPVHEALQRRPRPRSDTRPRPSVRTRSTSRR